MQEQLLLAKKKSGATTNAVFNASMKSSTVALSNNNLHAALGNTGGAVFAGTASRNTGKYYFEVTATLFEGNAANSPLVGLASQNTAFNTPWTSSGEMLWYCYGAAGVIIYANNARLNYGLTSFYQGDVVGFAADLDAKLINFYRNGVAQGQLNIATYVPGVSAFWPCVASPDAQSGASAVDIPVSPKYLPSGYLPW